MKDKATYAKKMRKALLFLLLLGGLLTPGCATQEPPTVNQPDETPTTPSNLTLVTGTTLYDSGLLDYLLPYFEEEKNYDVKVISLGTGQALELGKNGDADVVLVHDRPRELEMVEQGYFVNRYDVMHNDFILVGPETDPAGIKYLTEAKQVFTALGRRQSPFVSRGDNSGTHSKEQALWQAAAILPQGSWHISAGSGMSDTLRMADEMKAYALTDRGTYLSMRGNLDLVMLFEDPTQLVNQYGVMAVNPANHPEINFAGAKAFIEFMISESGQQLIANYMPFGETLFFPNAE